MTNAGTPLVAHVLCWTITKPRSRRYPHQNNRAKVIAACARFASLLLLRRRLSSASRAKRCATTTCAVECRVLVCRLTRAVDHAPWRRKTRHARSCRGVSCCVSTSVPDTRHKLPLRPALFPPTAPGSDVREDRFAIAFRFVSFASCQMAAACFAFDFAQH